MNLPKLSIVMPVFNHPRLVRVMVDSIRANDFRDWELLAVDDGSDEDTLRLLRDYASEDARVLLVRRDIRPKGAQTCRNMGLRMARGEFVVFFDSDDCVTKNCLRVRVKGLAARKDLDFLVFPSGVVQDGEFSATERQFMYGFPIYADDVAKFCCRQLPFVVWNNIYRTESLREKHLSWDEKLRSLQDADFNLQALLAGLRYGYAREAPDYGYRIDAGAGSVSRKIMSAEHRQSHAYAIEKFYRSVQQNFGHRYDRHLYRGVLHLYNHLFTDGVDEAFAKQMAQVVCRYDAVRGCVFRLQIVLTCALERMLPRKMARQLPMVCFLIAQRWRIRRKVAAIVKIQQNKVY